MRISTSVAAACIVIAGAATTPARGDVVHLNDGTSMTGDIKKAADGWYVTDAHGKTVHIPADRVRSIAPSPRGADPAVAGQDRLASLRRSVAAFNDAKTIIDRYEKFIELNKGQPIAEDAKKELAQWKERQSKGMVKVGQNWVLPEERAKLQEQALLVVDQARTLLKQRQRRDADAAVTKALEVDPKDALVLFNAGLMQVELGEKSEARKSFNRVVELADDDDLKNAAREQLKELSPEAKKPSATAKPARPKKTR